MGKKQNFEKRNWFFLEILVKIVLKKLTFTLGTVKNYNLSICLYLKFQLDSVVKMESSSHPRTIETKKDSKCLTCAVW